MTVAGLLIGTGGCHRNIPIYGANSHPDDVKVLQLLKSSGADLSKPAQIIHYLYFNTNVDASAAASELKATGFSNVKVAPAPTALDRAPSKAQYSCIAETCAVPSEDAVFTTTDRMEALAKKHSGTYDGWEASVEK
jgi:hypothetical protein